MVLATRLIPVLLVNEGKVVQTRQFSISNIVHTDCVIAAKTLGVEDADEVIVLDITRGVDTGDIQKTFSSQFKAMADTFNIPLTAGGHVNSIGAVDHLMNLGADKICINTSAHYRLEFIQQIADRYGSQILTVSIDVKGMGVMADMGMWWTKKNAFDFARQCVDMGAGELLLNSITHDGMGEGYALETFQTIAESVPVPVIYLGGVRKWEHLVEGVEHGASAVAAANIFHYKENAVREAKKYMKEKGINVRPVQ